MEINILHLTEGARQAKGLTVIIDVFRAFTVEAFLMRNNAARIIPVSSVDWAFAYRQKHPEAVLCGERKGVIVDGFDYGNSPSQIENTDFTGKTVIHTTSAGTQGIANAVNAEEILGGSLVTARAIAAYIRQKKPQTVSLVCMGLGGARKTDEDELCALYIRGLVTGNPVRVIEQRIARLKYTDGAKFFDESKQAVFPERDFHLSTARDSFDFVLRLQKDPETGLGYMERVNVTWTEEERTYTQVKPGDLLSRFSRQEVIDFPDAVKREVCYGKYSEPEGNFDGALVLGGPAGELRSRAEAAAELYRRGRCRLLVPTGGVKWETEFGYMTECEALHRYLVEMGVPEEAILSEKRATSTRENMEFAKALLAERIPIAGARLVTVTAWYHLRRGVLLAAAYIPEAQHVGIHAQYPKDTPEEYCSDPDLSAAVTTECRCLLENVQRGLIEDFAVI